MATIRDPFARHLETLRACAACPGVQGPPVVGAVRDAQVVLLGQAPGPRERDQGRPFVWTAGTTLFRWFASIGVEEAAFRRRVHMAAVIRCFPGKLPGGQGDRPPARDEIAACAGHFETELALLRPRLVLAVGKMAIARLLPPAKGGKTAKLDDLVGRVFPVTQGGQRLDCIPLPHPSGLNRWLQTGGGKALTENALQSIARHPAWIATFS